MLKTPVTPIAVSPRDAARIAGVSRSRIYELIGAGELPAYKDGARTLILVADIEAWLARLRAVPKSGPSVGPLLPPAERKRARRRARELETDATEPLLPPEQQQIAVERASEPPSPAEPDYGLIYRERLRLIGGSYPGNSEEPRLRAIEHAVNTYRSTNGCGLEDAKAAVRAAIAERKQRGEQQ